MTTATLIPDATIDALAALPSLVRTLLTIKGQIVALKTERDAKMRKGKAQIRKESSFTCRIGCDYNNLEVVQIKREVGILPETPQPRPWGVWVPGLFPYVAEHKGNYYFRCTVFNSTTIPKVRWLRDGVEITREEAQVDCLGSEFSEKDNDVFDLKVASILEVNGKAV
jgi:hypothetical protein